MEVAAESKNVKMSPRKVRLVVDSVKKMQIATAISQLTGMSKRAAIPVKKTLESAIANAVHNLKLSKDDLVIKEILVSEGVKYKRYHFAARGRVRPYKRRTSHIRVILASKNKGGEDNSKVKSQDSKGQVKSKKEVK